MAHPKIKFRIDPEKDIKTFYGFLHDAVKNNTDYFESRILALHPKLKEHVSTKTSKVNKDRVEKYIKTFYQENKKEIESNIEKYKNNWLQIKDSFYNLTNDLFPQEYWPEGKYIAYSTIWGIFPRFLEDKTFQIPHKHEQEKYVNAVIAHEMLHFIFYNYFLQNWKGYKEDSKILWKISEIFNTVVQNSPEWMEVFKTESTGYPEQKKIVKRIQAKHENNLKTDILIEDIIKEIS